MATYNFDEVGVYDLLPGGTLRTIRGGNVRFRRYDTDAVVATVPVGSNGRVSYGSNTYGSLVMETDSGFRRVVFAPEALADAANVGTELAAKVDKGAIIANVMDYGAVGDGSTNDTDALALALAAIAPGGRLLINRPLKTIGSIAPSLVGSSAKVIESPLAGTPTSATSPGTF